MRTEIDLDHVAVAVEDQHDAWPRYAGDLAGRWVGGGGTAGFWSAQVAYANGMKVEVLQPHRVDLNDFLRRFLDRSGPGPHHLTFKVDDIGAALTAVEGAGYAPVGVNLASPWWKEAFLHPKDAPGIVVQLAQSSAGGDWEDDPPPTSLPAPRTPTPATLVHITHAVADLAEGTRLFRDLLGGSVVADEATAGLRWTELAWPGAGRLRLISAAGEAEPAAALRSFLGDRPGRLHHLAFVTEGPEDVPGSTITEEGIVVVDAPANHGVRLHLAADDVSFAHPVVG